MNTNNTDAWVALDRDGRRVKVGAKIHAPNGEAFVFQGISRAPGVGSSGKILVSAGDVTDEYYPRYFDMTLGYKPAMGKS